MVTWGIKENHAGLSKKKTRDPRGAAAAAMRSKARMGTRIICHTPHFKKIAGT
jgi:hypothetical protein